MKIVVVTIKDHGTNDAGTGPVEPAGSNRTLAAVSRAVFGAQRRQN